MIQTTFYNQIIELPLDVPISKLFSHMPKLPTDHTYKIVWNNINVCSKQYNIIQCIVSNNNKDIPIYKIYDEYLNLPTNCFSEHGINFNKSGLFIKFNRTIRVPDNDKNIYPLPPSLGEFKLFKNGDNIELPIYQKEALWMGFNCRTDVALKIGVGNVNAITGLPWEEGVLTQSPQNYVICPKQLWLDGIKINNKKNAKLVKNGSFVEDIVRQFVAVPIDSNLSIEQQLKDKKLIDNVEGGLKFEAYTLYEKNFLVYSVDKQKFLNINETATLGEQLIFYKPIKNEPYIDRTLRDYGIRENDTINITLLIGCGQLFVKTLTGKTITVRISEHMDVTQLKELIEEQEGIPVKQQRLIFAGKSLENYILLSAYKLKPESTIHLVLTLRGGGTPPDPRKQMSLAAGGLIVQKIYVDEHKLDDWNMNSYEKCKINIVNSIQRKHKMPPTPISADTYIKHGYPWYELYDEDAESIANVKNSLFNKILSLDKIKEENPETECCICMSNYANIKYNTCNHTMCSECLTSIIKNQDDKLSCHICRGDVANDNITITSGIDKIKMT